MTKLVKEKSILKAILVAFVMYLFALIVLFRANFYYVDDLGRAALGYGDWGTFSRYLSNFLAIFIHTDTYLTDISPLPQILAAFIMAAAGVIAIYCYTEEKEFSLISLISVLPLGLSPYFLQCFSYKYDAPYMAVSVLVMIAPALFRKKGLWQYALAACVGTLAMCMTYQSASGIFPMLVVLLLAHDFSNDRSFIDCLKELGVAVAGYVVGLGIFKLFIMKTVDTYVDNSLPSGGRIIEVALYHYKIYYGHILSDFKKSWLIIVGLLIVGFVWAFVANAKGSKAKAFGISALLIIFFFAMAFGVYPFLTTPLYDPRAMYGFGAVLAFFGIAIGSSQKLYPAKAVCVALAWIFVVFSFTYGTALSVQQEYTNERISYVVYDLNSLDIMQNGKVKNLQISGTAGYSPVIENMPDDYEMLTRLVPVLFKDGWRWGSEKLFDYYGIENIVKNDEVDLTEENLPMLKDTMFHTIYGDESNILVVLK